MACLIVVSSKGGNTRLVADAVARELGAAGQEVAGPMTPGDLDDAALAAADTVLAGFWTDKGDCAPELAAVLERLDGKRVFLFGTAGFGGSDAYFAQLLDRVRGHLPEGAAYLGGAMCQGKMGAGVRARYEGMLAEHPDDERIKGMIANFDAALAHPDEADLARIAAAARTAVA